MNAPTASGSDCSILIAERLRTPYGSGTGSAMTAGCPLIAGAVRGQRHVVGLQRAASPVITGANAAFTHAWISGTLRKLVVSLTGVAPRRDEPLAHVAVDADVGAAEAIDRLLRVADDEEAAGDGDDRAASRPASGSADAEQQQDLRLQRIGVLELVDEDVREARVKPAADAGVAAHQVARLEQQVEEVERAGPRLQLLRSRRSRRCSSCCSAAARSASAFMRNWSSMRLERVVGVDHALARDALLVAGPAPVARASRSCDRATDRRAALPTRRSRSSACARRSRPAWSDCCIAISADEVPRRGGVEDTACPSRTTAPSVSARELVELRRPADRRRRRDRTARRVHGAGEVAPLGQVPRRAAEPIDRRVLARDVRRTPARSIAAARAARLRADPAAAPGSRRRTPGRTAAAPAIRSGPRTADRRAPRPAARAAARRRSREWC